MKHFKIVGPKTTKEFNIKDDEMITWQVFKIDDYAQKGQCHEPEELEETNKIIYDNTSTTDFITQFSKMTYQQIIVLYKQCKEERESSKTFDYEKVYLKLLKFYIDEKDYSKEHANEIATKIAEQQKIEWNKRK